MLIALISISVLLLASSLIIINLLRKVEMMEDYVKDLEDSNLNYYTFFSNLKSKVRESYSRMKNIDRLGSFEADDETGFIFKELNSFSIMSFIIFDKIFFSFMVWCVMSINGFNLPGRSKFLTMIIK